MYNEITFSLEEYVRKMNSDVLERNEWDGLTAAEYLINVIIPVLGSYYAVAGISYTEVMVKTLNDFIYRVNHGEWPESVQQCTCPRCTYLRTMDESSEEFQLLLDELKSNVELINNAKEYEEVKHDAGAVYLLQIINLLVQQMKAETSFEQILGTIMPHILNQKESDSDSDDTSFGINMN